MPPQSRKRRAPVDDDIASSEPSRNRRHRSEEEDDGLEEEDEEHSRGSGSIPQLAKSLVRYALACEYARVPIKRQDVSQKVLGSHSRSFRPVFDAANCQLMDTFGMEMVELANREKTTMRQKRAAAASKVLAPSQSESKSSNQWVLRTVLPEQFRTPAIIGSPQIPDAETESSYHALYTMIISLIGFSGGVLSESKLDRFLKRMNSDENTPAGHTEEVIKRMAKDGYIVRVKDSSSGEEVIDYHVGPRGKVEVDTDAITQFTRKVYTAGDAVEDLEERLDRSLKVAKAPADGGGGEGDGDGTPGAEGDTQRAGGAGPMRGSGRPRRRREESEDE